MFTTDFKVSLVYYTPVSLCGFVASASHGGKITEVTCNAAKELSIKLAVWKHLEPLEVSLFVFDCYIPLFVASQLNRHRIGCSRTQQSLRYCTIENAEFYVDDVMKAVINKESLEELVQKVSQAKTKEEKESLNRLLPSNLMVKYRCAFNARSFAHLCETRLSKHAQPVTQKVVAEMLRQVMHTEWREVFDELLFFAKLNN